MLDSFLKCGFWSEIVSSRFLMCVVFPESCWDFVTGPCEICGCSLGLIGIPLLSIRLCSEWFHGRWHGARDRKVKDKRAHPWIVVWSCSCSTPQYSANRSIRKQHQTTSLDRGKLSRFFSGTIWAPPCTLPKKTSRDNNKKLPKEANPRAQKHVFGAQNEAKMVKNRGPGAFQQQSGSEQGPEVKKDQKL